MEDHSQMWTLYEEWQEGFTEKAQQDWITFRLMVLFRPVEGGLTCFAFGSVLENADITTSSIVCLHEFSVFLQE